MKKVILITSTYNGAKFLPTLLNSIFSQTYQNLELWVRDDGSLDDSVNILREYSQKAPEGKKIVLVNELTNDWNNKGAHQSYHTLIHYLPEADYYFFCDQDDVWEPEKVERGVSHMEQYPSDIPLLYVHNYYICDSELHVESTLPSRPTITPEKMRQINLAHVIMSGTWGGVGMAQAFNHTLKQLTFDTGTFMQSIAIDCWISWVVAGMNGALIYDNKPLAYYRRHPGTFSSGDANGLLRYRDWLKHMERHCNNINNGIRDYHRLYGNMVSKERRDFLELFCSKKHLKKFFYPHRLRSGLMDEIAFRILILIGKI